MGMTRKQAIGAMVGRHRAALEKSQNFRCCCCDGIFPSGEASHVAAYAPQNELMKQLVPGENIATYVVCKECARMPERTMLMKVEQYLIKNGLFRKDLKPLDAPGGHSPGHQHRHGPNCSHGKGGNLFPGRG
jgi:hypothetical protein